MGGECVSGTVCAGVQSIKGVEGILAPKGVAQRRGVLTAQLVWFR